MKDRLETLEAELRAIKTREKWYVSQNRWDEMVPWFDFTDNERAQAIAYWSD